MSETEIPVLGRTVHIVGPVVNVATEDTPHPMVDRGLVGKALLSWRNNRSSRDPLKRVVTNNQGEDTKNTFSSMLGKIPTGAVRTEPMTQVSKIGYYAPLKENTNRFVKRA